MTFKEYLFNLPNEKLAEYLVTTRDEVDYDYDYDENLSYCGTTTWYVTTDGEEFLDCDYEGAIEHQVKLLESEYTGDESEDENK